VFRVRGRAPVLRKGAAMKVMTVAELHRVLHACCGDESVLVFLGGQLPIGRFNPVESGSATGLREVKPYGAALVLDLRPPRDFSPSVRERK